MAVLGTVISVSLETDIKKQDGGTYKGWELIYKSNTGEVRTIAKPVQGLKFNAALRSGLQGLQPGDQFTLEQEKNAKGFNDVKSISKGWEQTAPQTSSPTPATRVTGSTYETKEERAAKQKYIVKQSSLSAAIGILTTGAKSPPSVDEVISLADKLVEYVFANEAVNNIASSLDDDDDIPF